MSPNEVVHFWFEELNPKFWFAKDEQIDALIRSRFLETHRAASQCELFSWRTSAEGRLAEILVLDQFSRNMFRGTAQSFSSDTLALALAQAALDAKADRNLAPLMKSFLYMPFMHSESQLIHQRAVQLFSEAGLENNLAFELRHKAIIDRFGRYPHRNAILGRVSTAEETEFLKQPLSGF